MRRSRPRGQHFVTKSYLRLFARRQGKKKAQVWVYDRKRPEGPWLENIDKAARRNDYYSFRQADGFFNDSIEELLSNVENEAIPLLKSLVVARMPTPSRDEKGVLATFIAFQEARVPGIRTMMEEGYAKMLQRLLEFSARAPGYLEQLLENDGRDPADVEQMRDSVLNHSDRYKIKVDESHSLTTGVRPQNWTAFGRFREQADRRVLS